MLADKFSRRRHLFVCVNERSSGKPACGVAGSAELLRAVQSELVARGDVGSLATGCACLGPCFDGPNAVIYADDGVEPAVWYGGLGVDDAAGLVDHLMTGVALAAKVTDRPGDE